MHLLTKQVPRGREDEPLAAVPPDPTRTYRVVEIAASIAKDRCDTLGIAPGTRIRPRILVAGELVLELPDQGHRICSLATSYARYIRVEPEERTEALRWGSRDGRPSGFARHPEFDRG